MTHTSTEQPEALRLAAFFETMRKSSHRWYDGTPVHEKAAAEFRHLHARNQELEAMLLKEVQHSADQRRRADQLEQQHAMQAKMHAQACEQLAAQAQRAPLLFNPFNGKPRHPLDVKSDPNGLLIATPGAELRATRINQEKLG